jgi:hypothetical protein
VGDYFKLGHGRLLFEFIVHYHHMIRLQTYSFETESPLRREDFSFLVSWGGVRPSPLGTSSSDWPIVPAPDDR